MTWKARGGLALWLALGVYLWFAYPEVMAVVLLAFLVASMFVLSVMAIAMGVRRKRFRKI